MDWKKLVQLAAPAAAGLASHGQQGAVLRGYMAEQDTIARERRQQAEQDRLHKAQGATMSLELLNRLQGETDPLRFEQLRNVITQNASAYGIDPAQFANMPMPDGSEGRLKELNDLIEKASKQGYDPDELAQSGASLELKDKSRVSVADALAMTRRRPIGANGEMVAPPKKADVSASTDYGRALSRFAKDRGKKVEELSWADEQQFKKEFGQADDKAATGPTDFTSRYLDNLVSLWKQNHPGQEPPADVQAQLMRQTRKDLGQADDKPTSDQLVQVTEVDPNTGELVTSLVPKRVGEVARRPGPAKKDPTQGEYTTAGYAGRMEQAEPILGKLEKDIAGMNVLSFGAQLRLPAAAQSAVFQSYYQAARNFINAVLRRESGAVISPEEFASANEQYLPQPGNTPEVLAQKKANRDYVFQTLKRASGTAYQPPLSAPPIEEWVRDAKGNLVRKGAN